jgi:hypothetical protein
MQEVEVIQMESRLKMCDQGGGAAGVGERQDILSSVVHTFELPSNRHIVISISRWKRTTSAVSTFAPQ